MFRFSCALVNWGVLRIWRYIVSMFLSIPRVDLGSDLDFVFMVVVQHRPVVVDVALVDFTAFDGTFIT